VNKAKRVNYLIDKPFQIGFILRFLLVILMTIGFCFGVIALYYYQDSLLGTNKLDQNVSIKTRGHQKTPDGNKIYLYDKEKIEIFEKFEKGKKVFYCENPFINTKYTKGSLVENVNELELDPKMGPIPNETKMFFIVIFPLLWMVLAICVVISIYSIFFSHKMAGPIYRIRISLERMIAGDLDFKIKVRKNDFFINIVEKLEQFRYKVKNNELSTSSAKDKLLELRGMIDNKSPIEDISRKLDNMLN